MVSRVRAYFTIFEGSFEFRPLLRERGVLKARETHRVQVMKVLYKI